MQVDFDVLGTREMHLGDKRRCTRVVWRQEAAIRLAQSLALIQRPNSFPSSSFPLQLCPFFSVHGCHSRSKGTYRHDQLDDVLRVTEL